MRNLLWLVLSGCLPPPTEDTSSEADADTDTDTDTDTDDTGCDTPGTWWTDADDDGYGDPKGALTACDQPLGTVENDDDCDDTSELAHPGLDEVCGDSLDNDCDTIVDETPTWWLDTDEDGYGDPAKGVELCDPPKGTVGNDLDCDDDDELINPDAAERCNGLDDNCTGGPGLDEVDGDKDSYLACEECDDGEFLVNPGRTEQPGDGLDNDCDGRAKRLEGNLGTGDLWGRLYTGTAGSELGAAVAVGDLYSSSDNELVVGGPGRSTDDGIVFATSTVAPGDDEIEDAADYSVVGGINQYFGCDVDVGDFAASAGDDLAAGASSVAAVFIWTDSFSGGTHDIDISAGSSSNFGTSLSSGTLSSGPLLAVGAPGLTTGAVYVLDLSGTSSGSYDADSIGIKLSTALPDGLGTSVAIVEGCSATSGCLVAGAPKAGVLNQGQVKLWRGTPSSGASPDITIDGDRSNLQLGTALAAIGDIDGDGRTDWAVGAPRSAANPGEVFIVFGDLADGDYRIDDLVASDAVAQITGESSADTFGTAIAAGDLDLDGVPDLVIGAPGDDRVVVFYGPIDPGDDLGSATAPLRFTGNGKAGTSLAVGDITGDDGVDIVIGAPDVPNLSSQASGAVLLLPGHPL